MIGPALLSVMALAASPQPDCAAVRAALPRAGECVAAGGGLVLAADSTKAQAMLDAATAGEDRFRSAFGRDPSVWAVFSFDDPATVADTSSALRSMGFTTVLHLPSDALRQQQTAEARRRFQEARGTAAPTTMVRREGVGGGGEPRGTNTVAHELGHLWYTHAFWPASPATAAPAPRRYGSAAPDWLDEAAAMLMEDESGTDSYRQLFARARRPDPQTTAVLPPEIPLATLIGMDHPALSRMPAAGSSAGPSAGPVTVVVPMQPSLFYPQVRVFTDYLIERSANPRILAEISEALSGGQTFDSWLVEHGPRNRLPASLAALQTDWDNWLDSGFGERAAARLEPR